MRYPHFEVDYNICEFVLGEKIFDFHLITELTVGIFFSHKLGVSPTILFSFFFLLEPLIKLHRRIPTCFYFFFSLSMCNHITHGFDLYLPGHGKQLK